MNATDLQKLKELAQAATPGPWTPCEPSGEDSGNRPGEQYHWSVRCPSKPPAISHQLCRLSSINSNEDVDAAFIAAANPAAVLDLVALAERAVSPAESVQSVDMPELHNLLSASYTAAYLGDGPKQEAADALLFAHIDASRASAHAEGRRSALEELHPQWMKEKERADRAEEALVEWYKLKDPASLHVNLLRGIPARLTTEQLLHIAGDGAQALAARQAPDLSKLTAWIETTDGLCQAEHPTIINPESAFVRLSALQALLAQPLQQEGGKEDRRHHEEPDGPNHPGHHDGHTCEAMGQMLADFGSQRTTPEEVIERLQFKAAMARLDFCFDVDAEGQFISESTNAMWVGWSERAMLAAAPQPSDNLQQASTAQAEPAVCHKDAGRCGAGGYCDDCHSAKEAASATDATPKLPSTPEEIIDFIGVNFGRREKSPEKDDWCYTMSVHDLLSAFRDWQDFPAAQATPIDRDAVAAVQQKLDSLTVYGKSTAQATPEGAELPPLPHTTYNGYSDGSEPLYTADQMHDYARAALAAQQNSASNSSNNSADQQEAEPVGEIIRDGFGYFHFHASIPWEDIGEGTKLYRAAPPQQVEQSVTAEMRAAMVEISDEIASVGNRLEEIRLRYLPGPPAPGPRTTETVTRYKLADEPPQQVDTGGLPV